MTTWMIRKTGSNSNGGTSPTIRSSGSDGVTIAGHTLEISSISATWTSADVGHGLNSFGLGAAFLITSILPQSTLTALSTNTSGTVTSAGLFGGLAVGQAVSGPGLAAGCVVTAIANASSLTVNPVAGVGAGTGTFTFGAKATCTHPSLTMGQGSGKNWAVGGAFASWQVFVSGNFPSFLPGDSVYVGAGIYRETAAVGVSGIAGSLINVIGDVDGAVTGDAGETRLTNFLIDDKSAANATSPLGINTQSYLSFSRLTLEGGSESAISNSNGAINITFTDCLFNLLGAQSGSLSIQVNSVANWLFDRCIFMQPHGSAGMSIIAATVVGPDYDTNITFRNCLMAGGVVSNGCVRISSSGSSPGHGGGVRFYQCTIISGGLGIGTVNTLTLSNSIPCEVHGCLIVSGVISLVAQTLGQIIEDNNWLVGSGSRTNVNIGQGSVSNVYAPIFELGQSVKTLGVVRPFLSPADAVSPLLGFTGFRGNPRGAGPPVATPHVVPGFPGWLHYDPPTAPGSPGTAAPIPKVDWTNRIRPAGGQSSLPAVGYMEFHDSAVKDTTTFDSSPSAKLLGPGDIEIAVPVDAGSAVISVRVRYDSLYEGQKFPSIQLVGDGSIGVASQEVFAGPGAWGVWQTITLADCAPTGSGFVRLRFVSYDGSGAGQVNFDTFAVT